MGPFTPDGNVCVVVFWVKQSIQKEWASQHPRNLKGPYFSTPTHVIPTLCPCVNGPYIFLPMMGRGCSDSEKK